MRKAGWLILGAAGAGWLMLAAIDIYLDLHDAAWPKHIHGDARALVITTTVVGLVVIGTAEIRAAVRDLGERMTTASQAYQLGRHRRHLDETNSRELRVVR